MTRAPARAAISAEPSSTTTTSPWTPISPSARRAFSTHLPTPSASFRHGITTETQTSPVSGGNASLGTAVSAMIRKGCVSRRSGRRKAPFPLLRRVSPCERRRPVARILFTSHYALPHMGGIEVVVDALARELGRRGHEVVHVASDALRPDERRRPAAPATYEVVRVPALNALEARAGVPWPLFGPRLLGVLGREVPRADVVHAHGLLYLDGLLALRMARRGGRAVRLATEHVGHVPYESRLLDRVQALALATVGRASAAAAQAIVVLNDKVRAEMAALAPHARLEQIANGVDGERYRPPAPGERESLCRGLGWDATPRLLFVGRL